MKCARCGADIPAGNAFCTQCGTPVAQPAQAAPPPPPPRPPYGQPYQQPYATPGWPPATPAAPYAPPRPARPGQSLKIIAGIMSIVAAVIVIVGSALPYAHLQSGEPGHYTSLSIFNAGPGASLNNLWFAAEPILVALLSIVGGILLLAARRDVLLTIVAAMLTALGAQTFFLFVGYALGLAYGTNKTGAGGGIGMLGGFMLAAAGIIALVGEASFFRRQAAIQD